VHAFQARLGYSAESRFESVYGEDYDMHPGDCVRVVVKQRTKRVFPGKRSALKKLETIEDLGYPWMFKEKEWRKNMKKREAILWQEGWPVVDLVVKEKRMGME
jgi:hypothetical protein